MAGMLDVGNNMKTNALAGMRRLTDLEKAREEEQKALDRKDEADTQQNKMTGAGLGAMAGMAAGASYGQAGGAYGAVAGAVIGYLAGSLF